MVTLHHIRQITILGIAAYFVSCVTSITEMSPVTRMSKPTRERSRGDLWAQRVVCGESTPGPYHHHQHQEASAISYHVAYLTISNTNTLTNMCLCYSARRNMLDPLTSLDSIFLPIPSWSSIDQWSIIMAKQTWIHVYPLDMVWTNVKSSPGSINTWTLYLQDQWRYQNLCLEDTRRDWSYAINALDGINLKQTNQTKRHIRP